MLLNFKDKTDYIISFSWLEKIKRNNLFVHLSVLFDNATLSARVYR